MFHLQISTFTIWRLFSFFFFLIANSTSGIILVHFSNCLYAEIILGHIIKSELTPHEYLYIQMELIFTKESRKVLLIFSNNFLIIWWKPSTSIPVSLVDPFRFVFQFFNSLQFGTVQLVNLLGYFKLSWSLYFKMYHIHSSLHFLKYFSS